MNNNQSSQQIQKLIAKHRQQASESSYDRKVAVMAVGAAARVIEDVSPRLPDDKYLAEVVSALESLQANYHDSDGEYSSGKGEIGSLLMDIQQLANEQACLVDQDKLSFKASDIFWTVTSLLIALWFAIEFFNYGH